MENDWREMSSTGTDWMRAEKKKNNAVQNFNGSTRVSHFQCKISARVKWKKDTLAH